MSGCVGQHEAVPVLAGLSVAYRDRFEAQRASQMPSPLSLPDLLRDQPGRER
jgi:hypothetical protein